MSKYNEVMNNIEVTEEMRSRILQNIGKEFADETKAEDVIESSEEVQAKELEISDNVVDFKEGRNQKKSTAVSILRYSGIAAAAVILLVSARLLFTGNSSSDATMTSGTTTTGAMQEIAQEAAAETYNEPEFIRDSWTRYDSVEQMAEATGVDYTDFAYLSSIANDVDYYLEDGKTATMIYDVTGNAITVREKKARKIAATSATASTTETAKPASADNNVSASDIVIGDIKVTLSGDEESFNGAVWTRDGIEYEIECIEKLSLEEMTELLKNILR